LWVQKTTFYTSTRYVPKTQTFGHFLTGHRKFRVKKALEMWMLICKLPLIVIVAPLKLYMLVNRLIGVGEFKYGVIGDHLFTGGEGVT